MTLLRDISQFWSLIHVAVVFLLLFRSKYSPKRTWITVLTICAVLTLVGLGLITAVGWENAGWITLVICTIPTLILFYFLSEYRDGRFFFTFCFSDTACLWLMQLTSLLDRLCGETYVVLFLSRLLLFPLAEFWLWKSLRRPYLELQAKLSDGWRGIACISAGFYLLFAATAIPVDIPVTDYKALMILLLVLFLMPFTYFIILSSLWRQILYYESRSREDLLAAQVAGLESRVTASQIAEETICIARHDLRHKLLSVEDMIQRDEKEEALAYIHTLRENVEYTRSEKWCADPLLDAVFSSYFTQAKQQGIRIRTKLSFPKELPADATELSTVFANALENAIRACAALPEEHREIVCTSISYPSLMFEIANPYSGEITFDKNGLPVTDRRGHGIGTRSIAAFCEKYNACYAYEAKDGWFRLKIAL